MKGGLSDAIPRRGRIPSGVVWCPRRTTAHDGHRARRQHVIDVLFYANGAMTLYRNRTCWGGGVTSQLRREARNG